MPPYPVFWDCLTRYLGLDADLSGVWWKAVCRASWSRSREWRMKLLLFAGREVRSVETVEAFWQSTCSPVALMQLVGDLVQERRLPHTQARERQHQPPPAKRRPLAVPLSAAQLAELAALGPMDRLSKYREI